MEIIKNNWQIKLFSLVTAIILWSYVIGLENPTMTKTIRGVEISVQHDQESNEDYSISGVNPETIDVTVSAKRSVLNNLDKSKIYAYVDLGIVKEGTITKEILYRMPDNVNIESSTSESASFIIEKNISKEVDVVLNKVKDLPDNFVLDAFTIEPNKITVQGVRSKVESIEKLEMKMDLSSVEEDQIINVNLTPVDKEGKEVKGVTLGQSFANLSMTVNKIKEVPIKVKTINKLTSEKRLNSIKIAPDKLIIKGKKQEIDAVGEIETKEIDLSKIDKNSFPVDLNLPSGIVPVNKDVEYVATIDYDLKTTKEVSIPVDKIRMINQPSNLAYEIASTNENITVKLKGFEDQLAESSKDSVDVYIDLSHARVGRNSYTIRAKAKNETEVIEISPKNLIINMIDKSH